jgi:predicted transcriptional regulator
MKALSLKQPMAELILTGKKTMETRHWNTKFRGEFLIHASSVDEEWCKHHSIDTDVLPTGAIVGKAKLLAVFKFKSLEQFRGMKREHQVLDDASYKDGRTYGFLLSDISKMKPIKCKGSLNFFDVKLRQEGR